MVDTVRVLIGALKVIEESDLPVMEYLHEHNGNPLVRTAEGAACAALVTHNGGCNLQAMTEIVKIEPRWKAYPGEQDSFGWLTGCIRTTKGVLVYG